MKKAGKDAVYILMLLLPVGSHNFTIFLFYTKTVKLMRGK